MFLTDALGSLVATTDSAGGVQSEVTYEPFGATELSSPAPAYRFTGRGHDEPLYLYYYRARSYHTDLQRFISEDPIGFSAGDVNLYGYVGNNPVNYTDPFGLERKCGNVPETPPGVDGCGSTYIDCLARCIEGGDPLNILGKGLLSAFDATLPKWMYGLPRGLGGAQPFTTPPSAALTLGARMTGTVGPVAVLASVRTVASVYSGAWIGYGVYLFGREPYCVQQCYTDACSH